MDKIREVLAEVRAPTAMLDEGPDRAAKAEGYLSEFAPRLAAALEVAVTCPNCDGSGVTAVGREPYYRNHCPACDGKGSYLDELTLAAIAAALEER